MSIVRGKCLWLTHCTQSNDSEELIWSIKRLEELFNNQLNRLKTTEITDEVLEQEAEQIRTFLVQANDNSDFEEQLKKILQSLKKLPLEERKTKYIAGIKQVMKIYEDLQLNIKPTFMSCFSEAKDSLSQWRGYGDDGRGIAIGFDINKLNALKNKGVILRKITYHPNMQNVIISNALMDYAIYGNDKIEDWINNILPTFKPIWFKEEEEWRLVYIPQKENALKLNGYFRSSKLQECFELPFSKEDFSVAQIVLGPKCTISKKDLIDFFELNNLVINENQIIKSELSYR